MEVNHHVLNFDQIIVFIIQAIIYVIQDFKEWNVL